jgi:hypothetical protein
MRFARKYIWFPMILKINTDYFPKEHKPTGLRNGDNSLFTDC